MSKKLMRKKLALMLANLKKKRKYYVELEYLESTGTQYIDTGFSPDANTRVDYKVQVTELQTGSEPFIGTRVGTTNNNRFLPIAWHTGDGQLRTSFGSKVVILNETASIGSVFIGSFLPSEYKTTINGVQYSFSGASFTKTQSNNLYIFAASGYSPDLYNCKGRMYYMKVFDNGVLVRDMIPVLDWNMTPCMYDKVSGQLFYNQGTGNFTAGREIHPVEYIESTGTQLINTGIPFVAQDDYVIKTRSMNFDTSKRSIIFSNYIAYNQYSALSLEWWAGSSAYNGKARAYNITNRLSSSGINTTSNDSLSINVPHDLELNYSRTNNSISLKWDGNTKTDTLDAATLPNYSGNFCLFLDERPSLPDTIKNPTRIYFLQIYHNSILVRDFIPAIDENGVGYMFDRVSHTIYDNAGTGAFKYPAREVEYLEGTGTQYIDTGVRGFADFEIGVKLRESVSNVSIFCGNNYRLERYNASNPYWRFRNNNDFYNSGVPITEYHVMKWKNDEIYSDDVKLQDFAKTWNVAANMTLFGASTSSSFPSMIYFCKLWNPADGTLLRDFVPAIKDGILGMLDKVNNVFYPNAGTGTFTTGKIVEPEYE